LTPSVAVDAELTLSEVRKQSLKQIEKNYIKEQLVQHKGKIKDSAKAAGITTRQLHKLMKRYAIRKEDFKSSPA